MIQLTAAALRQMYPHAPTAIFTDLAAWQRAFDGAGITATRTRLAYCCANMAQETGGFTIPRLTEASPIRRRAPARFGQTGSAALMMSIVSLARIRAIRRFIKN